MERGGGLPPTLARKSKEQFFSAGPFIGMRDTPEISVASSDKALLVQNCYPVPGGGGLTGRPGFALLSSGNGSRAQGVEDFEKYDGTRYTIYVYSGELYSVNWGALTTSKVITTANLSGQSITLSSTARVSMLVYTNKLVISDGTNVPFMWDGTTNGGLTKLTNCPALYGPPTVYYGKLFGIKASNRSTFVWSEENDATIGYETGGYNNAWDFTQADPERLTRLLGSNEALYVFKAHSVTAVSGAVDEDFVTSGTRSSISETVGTTAPWSVIYSRRTVFWLDRDGKPHMVRAGGEAIPIWEDFRETIRTTVLPSNLENAITVDYAPAHLILFGYTTNTSTYPDRMMVYDFNNDSPVAAAIWTGFSFGAMGMVYATAITVARIFHMHPTDGTVYYHGHTNTATWNDNGTAITHVVKCPPLGGDISAEFYFDRIDWGLRTDATAMTNSYDYVTNRGTSTAQTPGLRSSAHQALGINAHARWICPRVTHQTAGEQFGLEKVRVHGVQTTNSPGNI